MKVPTTRRGVLSAAIVAIFALLAPVAWAAVTTITLTNTAQDTSLASADGSYTDGWQWTVSLTAPADEPLVALKFNDFSNGSTTIPASGNIRIYSPQSSAHADAAHAISVSGNAWSKQMRLAADADGNAAGEQFTVVVQVKVPAGTKGSGYSANFDARSLPLPSIALKGNATTTIDQFTTYTDAGATGTDSDGSDISSLIASSTNPAGGVDTSVTGTTTITYTLTDAAGFSATPVTRTVVVNAAPPPVPNAF